MQVTVIINSCDDCRHKNKHPRAFIKGKAKKICDHPGANEWIAKKYIEYHWSNKTVKKKIPKWCPVKNGECY